MKYLPMTLKALETDEGPGEFEAILSTSAEDRDGEVVASGAFDPLPASVPIYYQHDWQQKALPIGRGTPFYDEQGALRIKGYYGSDERSQAVRKAVGEGLVDSMSAGYLPLKKSRSKGVQTVTKADLFEGSMTAIPVNKTALVTASKALREASWYTPEELRELDGIDVKAGARNSASDADRLQQIHDLAVANGASCAEMKAVSPAALLDEPEVTEEQATQDNPTEPEPDAAAALSEPADDATTDATGDEPAAEVAAKSVDPDEIAARLSLVEAELRLAFG